MKSDFNGKNISFKGNKEFLDKNSTVKNQKKISPDIYEKTDKKLSFEQDKLAQANMSLVRQTSVSDSKKNTKVSGDTVPLTTNNFSEEQVSEPQRTNRLSPETEESLPGYAKFAREKFPDEVFELVNLHNVNPNEIIVGLAESYRKYPEVTLSLLQLENEKGVCLLSPFDIGVGLVEAYITDPKTTMDMVNLRDENGECRLLLYEINQETMKFYSENQDIVNKALNLKDENGCYTIDSIGTLFDMYQEYPEELTYVLNLQNKKGENLINKPETIEFFLRILEDTPRLKTLFEELVKMEDLQKFPFLFDYCDLQYSSEQKIKASRTVEYTSVHFDEAADGSLKKVEKQYQVVQNVELLGDGTIKKSKVTLPKIEQEISQRTEQNSYSDVQNENVDDTQIVVSDCENSQEHWYYGTDSVVITKPLDTTNSKSIEYQIEIVNGEDGQPSYILHTKLSDLLDGAYNVTRYNLADYPETVDILSAIKDGTIDDVINANNYPEGTKLSTISQEGNTIKCVDTRLRNGFETSRNYTREVDNDGKIVSTTYTYEIKDQKGKTVAFIDRSWKQNSDGSTTTTVNGKEYHSMFNDDTMEISITQPNGTVVKFSAIDKYGKLEEEVFEQDDNSKERIEVALKELYGTEENARLAFYNFLKTLPADQLTIYNEKVDKTFMVFAIKSNINLKENRMCVGEDLSAFAHELGHGIDGLGYKISNSPELIDVYNKEIALFKKEYPPSIQDLISYFSQFGGSNGSGLSEFFAETNMLSATYAQSEPKLITRAHYIFEYFPETVACILNLLGYDNGYSMS